MLQRINELSVKASTGTLTPEDREIVNKEVAQLKDEISRITTDTQFNGQGVGCHHCGGIVIDLHILLSFLFADLLNKPDIYLCRSVQGVRSLSSRLPL